jgi:hypothetical protein
VLRCAEAVVVEPAPHTTGGTIAKVPKLGISAPFLTVADLAAAPEVRVERELDEVARAFRTADSTSAAGGRLGTSTSRAMIDLQPVSSWAPRLVNGPTAQ